MVSVTLNKKTSAIEGHFVFDVEIRDTQKTLVSWEEGLFTCSCGGTSALVCEHIDYLVYWLATDDLYRRREKAQTKRVREWKS
uniref:SWIM-type domain-containing protein n=1 Tax=viral metagenome TaxID=1070528 RepID=A0A6M3IUD3_9ZZZZ